MSNSDVTYLTIIAGKSVDVGESAIMGVRIKLSNDSKSYDVKTKLLIRTGEQETFAYIEAAVIKTLISLKVNEQCNSYKVWIEKIKE